MNKQPVFQRSGLYLLVFLWMLGLLPAKTQGAINGNLSIDTVDLSLEKAIELAIRHNADVKLARIDQQIARQLIRETTAIGLPQINLAAGYQYYFDVPTSLVPAEFFGGDPGDFLEIQFGTEQSLTASANISQLIFSGEYIVGLRAARIYRELASQEVIRSELEVRSLVSESYYMVLMLEESLRIMKQNQQNLNRSYQETLAILEQGLTDPINADQLRLSLINMQHRISGLARQHKVSSHLLKFQIGIDMDTEIILSESLAELFNQLSMSALTEHSFDPQAHIEARIMDTRERFGLMALRREQSQFLPSLNASFVRQEMAMRNQFDFLKSGQPWFPTTFFGINLNIPVFSSGMRAARVSQARLELEKIKLGREQVNQSVKLAMLQARSSMQTALEQYQQQQENLDLAKRIWERTQIMHREGMASSLELTQASDQYLATQALWLESMFDVLSALEQIQKASGR